MPELAQTKAIELSPEAVKQIFQLDQRHFVGIHWQWLVSRFDGES